MTDDIYDLAELERMSGTYAIADVSILPLVRAVRAARACLAGGPWTPGMVKELADALHSFTDSAEVVDGC